MGGINSLTGGFQSVFPSVSGADLRTRLTVVRHTCHSSSFGSFQTAIVGAAARRPLRSLTLSPGP